ncbi:LysR family transcriptional regulator [Longimycelium tulufanense]|uniref:LysR family transcriptional regulator n=1 Tax=Longimycelium tulufanense TaxID=907463 RepID=A0A8J3FSX1_9PSEU|nr:LysR family transcriptional regulator [Longimycelium tulufanense]GGM40357.1 LysR family transcriptional regulator [Longimycelium tulufanense]
MATLRQLEYLIAVVEHGSFTEAAAALHVSQPALSHQVKALERATGTPLLERLPRGVVLTPAGRAYLGHARAAVAAAALARRSARAVAGAEDGELYLASVLSVALGVVPSVLRAWYQRYPGVDVVLQEFGQLAPFHEAIASGAADVAIGPLAPGWQGPVHELGREHFVVITGADDSLVGRETVGLAELADRRWVHYASSHGFAPLVEDACAAAGFTPHAAIRTTQTGAVPRLVSTGLGVGLVPANIVDPEFPGGVLRPDPPIRRMLAAYSRPGPDPLMTEFLQVARESAEVTPEHLKPLLPDS